MEHERTVTSAVRLYPYRRLPWYSGPTDRMLAGAEALLEALPWQGIPAVRWYTTSDTALVMGAGQNEGSINIAACRTIGMPLYRRAAGGTVVLVTPDMLGLDLAFPAGHPLLLGDLTQSYRFIGEAWARALARFGVAARLVDVDEARADRRRDDDQARLARLACYGGLSPFEVLVDGRKVVGFAQVRRRHGALFQIALLMRSGVDTLAGVLGVEDGARVHLREALGARIAGLDEVVSDLPAMTDIAVAFEQELAAVGLIADDAIATPLEEAIAARLRDDRYLPISSSRP